MKNLILPALGILVIVVGYAAVAARDAELERQEREMRRIATDVACRTIVEANLVRNCLVSK